jgi:hypothetical protein
MNLFFIKLLEQVNFPGVDTHDLLKFRSNFPHVFRGGKVLTSRIVIGLRHLISSRQDTLFLPKHLSTNDTSFSRFYNVIYLSCIVILQDPFDQLFSEKL